MTPEEKKVKDALTSEADRTPATPDQRTLDKILERANKK